MNKYNSNILACIGLTPMVRLNKVSSGCPAEILAKLEMFNPGGSAKARAAMGMISDAEERGILGPDSVLVEPTSGNQGIALAMVGAVKGYRTIVVMPDSMSMERRQLAAAYGAEVVLTPGLDDVAGAVKKAGEIVKNTKNAWMPDQFTNPANPKYHEQTTAREIMEQTGGRVDAFVAGVGTGGTITGVARVLKRECPGVKVYAVEPANSAVISGKKPGKHGIQGIGDGFIPDNFDPSLMDEPFAVDDRDAFEMGRRLAREEGLLVGISSGAACFAALQIGKGLGPGKRVVVMFPDTGERYLSTDLFSAKN